MKKICFLILFAILLVFSSACSNTTMDNVETENEGISINQSLGFGDGLFQVTLVDADIQGSEMTMNVQVENNSDKDEIVSSIMNMSVTQNNTDLNSDFNQSSQENQNNLSYSINPGATADLTFIYTLEDTTNPVDIQVYPGDGTGFNIPGESILNVSINPKDGTVDTEEAKIEG